MAYLVYDKNTIEIVYLDVINIFQRTNNLLVYKLKC